MLQGSAPPTAGTTPLWKMVASAIFGAVVSLFIRRIFDKPLDRWERKIGYFFRTTRFRLQKLNIVPYHHDEFRIGKWRTPWITVEGSSSDPYIPANVVCQLDPTPIALPPERQREREKIEAVQSELEKSGSPREYHDGPTVALAAVGRGQVGYTEAPFLALRLRPSAYYNYLATTMCLDDAFQEEGSTDTVRSRYLRDLHYESPFAEFVGAFAINLAVITKDGFIVVAKRGTAGVFPYGGYISPAINECINPVSDRNASGTLSLFATAQRGANHELNIEITEDELVFFTLGVDVHWYSYLLTGMVRSKTVTCDDIKSRRTLGSKERWETEHLYFLPHDLDAAAKFMSESSKTERWSPVSIVCLTQTLIVEFGTKKTERALSKYGPQRLKDP